ncbi:DUF481 domain-containing protein [Porticoccaceae bacterium LTM1]|nr:DUF481 domain-containing protein [Porticoccaceae bacterium LTM1]
MKLSRWVFVIGFSAVFNAAANELDSLEPKAPSWKGEGALGFSRTSGNSNAETLTGNLTLTRKNQAWEQTYKLSAVVREAEGRKNKQNIWGSVQLGYNFSKKIYSFANMRHEEDRFGPFQEQGSLSSGVGWRMFTHDDVEFRIESGVGYRRSVSGKDGSASEEMVYRGLSVWKYKLDDGIHLVSEFRVESGSINTVTESDSSIRFSINEKVGLKFNYRIKNNSTVPEGRENSDDLTAFSVTYKFT